MKKLQYSIPKLRTVGQDYLTDCVDGSGASSDGKCSTGSNNVTNNECIGGNVATNVSGGGDGCGNGDIATNTGAPGCRIGNQAFSPGGAALSCFATGGSPNDNPPNSCYTGGGAA